MNHQTSATLFRKSRSNFSSAFWGLSSDRRKALEIVYAYCRIIDDIADESTSIEIADRELSAWRNALANYPHISKKIDSPVARDLEWAISKFPILESDLMWILDGMEMDLEKTTYATMDELVAYCDAVATAVGFCCMSIFEVDRNASRNYVYATGRALQLTNILRDVTSDARRGRIYIPQSLIIPFDLSNQDILDGCYDAKFVRMAEYFGEQIQGYYDSAETFSGDHSTAPGSVAGIKSALPKKRIGVLWFDAHADIHSPYTSPSGNLHGMPVAAITGQNNLDRQRQSISSQEEKLWKQLQNLAGETPMVQLKDVVWVGLRDLEMEEKALLDSNSCLTITAEETLVGSAKEIGRKITQHLGECDAIYVSFDVDCLDRDLVPGTGTPVGNGPNVEKISQIISAIGVWDRLVCFEMSEVNPVIDRNGQTSRIAAEIVHQFLQKVK